MSKRQVHISAIINSERADSIENINDIKIINKNNHIKPKKNKERKFKILYKQLSEKINAMSKDLKSLKHNLNKLCIAYDNDIKKIEKDKKRKNTKSGIQTEKLIPDDLADFIGVKYGTKLSRAKLQKRVCGALKEKGLYYKKDKRIFRVDQQVMKIFNIKKDVNNVIDAKDKSGFTIYTLQTYLAKKLRP